MTSGAHFGDQAPSTTPQAGDAGANFLSSLLNAPTDAEGAKRVSDGGQQLKALAQSGGFRAHELGRLEKLVQNNQQQLLESWDEYFNE